MYQLSTIKILVINKCNNNIIRILYYNARSLLPKFDNLLLKICVNAHIYRPHIICVVETWLSDEISNTENFYS